MAFADFASVPPAHADRQRRSGLRLGILWALAATLAMTTSSAKAERIELGDGSVLMGTLADDGGKTVTIRLDLGAVITVPRTALGRAAAPTPAMALLRFHGSNAMGEGMALSLIERFVAARGGTVGPWLTGASPGEKTMVIGGSARLPREIEVRAFGSNTAFPALQNGATDIGLSGRPIRDSEAAGLRGVTEQMVALDGIAVVVHPGNPVRALTVNQLVGIFSGDIGDWSAVGGAPGPIALRIPDERSALPDIFQTQIMAGRRFAATAERLGSSPELTARVAAEPGSIGLVSLAYVDQSRALDIQSCSGPVAPTSFTVKAGDYPLSRRLFFYAKPKPRPAVIDDFLAFSIAPAGQSAIATSGFVNLDLESDGGTTRRTRRQGLIEDNSIDIALARAFLKVTEGASRLSLTFRFEEGGVAPAGTPDEDIRRLVAFMKSPMGQRHQLLVLGFSGPTDAPQKGTVLSENRAKEIATRLGKAGLKVSTVAGFGPLVAQCAEAPDNRERSRRVEIWMR